MEKFSSKLDKANIIYNEMKIIIESCRNYTNTNVDPWAVLWESFWELSNEFPFNVDWCDFDTSYEEDMMQRYNAVEGFMEGLLISQERYDEQ